MDKKAVVIAGEAPESDDDALDIKTGAAFRYLSNASGIIIPGEATESDDDGGSFSSASTAVDATACPPYITIKSSVAADRKFIKYNSLLHKKLHVCNESLRENVLHLTDNTLSTGIQELTGINKQLVKSELTVQEAACQLRNASARWNEASSVLFQIIDGNFLNTIKT